MDIDDVVNHFKDSIVKIGVEGVMGVIATHAPFFNLPIISTITRDIVGCIVIILVDQTELGAYFVYVKDFTDDQKRDFEDKAMALERAKETGDLDAIERAEMDKIDAARRLIRLNS